MRSKEFGHWLIVLYHWLGGVGGFSFATDSRARARAWRVCAMKFTAGFSGSLDQSLYASLSNLVALVSGEMSLDSWLIPPISIL